MTDGLCYLEFSDGAYFSSDALYLSQVDYDSPSDIYRTYLHDSIWATRSLTQAPEGLRARYFWAGRAIFVSVARLTMCA